MHPIATFFETLGTSLSLFGAFGLGAIGGYFLNRRGEQCGWRLFALASLSGIGYLCLLLGLPFWGFPGEMLILIAAGAALVLPMAAFWSAAFKSRNQNLRRTIPLGLLFFAFVPVVLSTLLDRNNYTQGLHWTCDGQIVERTRTSGNHDALTLVVQSEHGMERFEGVAEALWNQAEPGQRLTKIAGSPTAMLNGKAFRIVPRNLPWWNEPP